MVRLALCLSILVFPLLLVTARVRAGEGEEADLARARQLFAQAQALEAKAEWHQAAEHLRQALRIKATPGLYYHLAFCLQESGSLLQALENYDRAEALLANGQEAGDVAALLGPARVALLARVPTLTIHVRPAQPAGLSVRVDDREVGGDAVGRSLRLARGRHRVVVAATGYRESTRVVDLVEGARETMVVTIETIRQQTDNGGSDPDLARDVPPPRTSVRTPLLIVEGSVAIAGLAVGTAYWMVRSSALDDAARARAELDRAAESSDSACLRPAGDAIAACRSLRVATDDAARATELANLGFAAAGVGAVAAVATWYFWPTDEVSARWQPTATMSDTHGFQFGVLGSF